jgi:hypothetical protein
LLLYGGLSSVYASEVGTTADVMESGKWSLGIIGRDTKIEPTVRISDVNSIQVPTTGGPATIFSSSNADVKMTQTFEELIGVLRFRPHDGLTYRVKAGTVHNFDLEYSSGAHTNKLQDTGEGFVWGLGAAWNVLPGTIVSPAITIDLGLTEQRSKLDRFESPGVVAVSGQRFVQDEVQAAVNVSKRFNNFEPYGGLKISRVVSTMKDDATKEQLRGQNDFAAPFIGLSVQMFPGETVFVEGSFLDERGVNFGLNITF